MKPGLLVQYVEQARAKIQKMMSENQKHKTMVTLTEDGQLDSDPTQAQGFTAAELEPLKERCRKYWTAPQNKEQYQRLRLGLQTQFYYLTETQLTEAFLSTMNAAELPDILRNMVDPPQRISPSTARLLSLNGSRRPAAPLRVSTSASWILPSLLLLICQAPHLHHLHLSLELTWDLSLRL